MSDGTVEALPQTLVDNGAKHCELDVSGCLGWVTLSSPSEGLNAAADINFDEQVDGADLAFLLSRWGDAPRNPMPPSDCPLGLLNPS